MTTSSLRLSRVGRTLINFNFNFKVVAREKVLRRMCWSLRGCAYYGASLHISVGLLFLGGFFIDLMGISDVWHNPYATYFSLILAFIYICLFLVFGCLIFQGVEKESSRLLKGSVAGLLALQISAFLVYLALLAVTYSKNKEEFEQRNVQNQNSAMEGSSRNESSNTSMNKRFFKEDVDAESTPVITLMQVIALVLGVLTTLMYSAVLVLYVRNECPSRGQRRP